MKHFLILFFALAMIAISCKEPIQYEPVEPLGNTAELNIDSQLLGAWQLNEAPDLVINFGNYYYSGNDGTGMFEGKYIAINETLFLLTYGIIGNLDKDLFSPSDLLRYHISGDQLTITVGSKTLVFKQIFKQEQ